MWREELGWPHPRPQPAQPCNALTGMIDNRHSRSEIGDMATDRLHRSQFANVADRTLARGHEQPARPMQVVPLGLVFAIAIEHLDPMVLAIGNIHPTIRIARNVVSDVELTRISTWRTP